MNLFLNKGIHVHRQRAASMGTAFALDLALGAGFILGVSLIESTDLGKAMLPGP